MASLDSREGSCIEYKLSGGKLCNKRGTQVWSAQSATWSSLWRQSFDTRHSLLDALNRSHQICPYSCQKPFFPAALNDARARKFNHLHAADLFIMSWWKIPTFARTTVQYARKTLLAFNDRKCKSKATYRTFTIINRGFYYFSVCRLFFDVWRHSFKTWQLQNKSDYN